MTRSRLPQLIKHISLRVRETAESMFLTTKTKQHHDTDQWMTGLRQRNFLSILYLQTLHLGRPTKVWHPAASDLQEESIHSNITSADKYY